MKPFGLHDGELPEGVSPGNDKPEAYAAPDMATPLYAHSPAASVNLNAKAKRIVREQYEEIIEDDDDDEEDDWNGPGARGNPPANNVAILIALTALLAALAAIVVVNNRNPTPLCSSQPEWNQYNCRPG